MQPLVRRASAHLAASGRRALARDDPGAAVSLLRRAAALYPTVAGERLALLPDLGEAMVEAGDLDGAGRVFDECVRLASGAGDLTLAADARVAALQLRFSVAPEGWSGPARAQAERALDLFAKAGAPRGLARTWFLLAFVHHYLGHLALAERACTQASVHARRAGDHRTRAWALANLAIYGFYGPLPVHEGISRCAGLLDELADDHVRSALVLDALASLHAMRGDAEEAARTLARADAVRAELGGALWKALGSADIRGQLYLLQGNLPSAEQVLRTSYEHLKRIGETAYLSTHAALLAHAVARQGRDSEAEELTRVSEASAASDDVLSQVLWRSAQAEVLRRRGAGREASAVAAEAVRFADATDLLNITAGARMELARTLLLLGRADDAARTARQALDLYEGKGNLLAATAVYAWLETAGA